MNSSPNSAPIHIENKVDLEGLPTDFVYIPKRFHSSTTVVDDVPREGCKCDKGQCSTQLKTCCCWFECIFWDWGGSDFIVGHHNNYFVIGVFKCIPMTSREGEVQFRLFFSYEQPFVITGLSTLKLLVVLSRTAHYYNSKNIFYHFSQFFLVVHSPCTQR